MSTHLILYRLDRDLMAWEKAHGKLTLGGVPVTGCGAKYTVMRQLKVEPRDISCPTCKASAADHKRFNRWMKSAKGRAWMMRDALARKAGEQAT